MQSVPLGSQNTVEFTSSLLFFATQPINEANKTWQEQQKITAQKAKAAKAALSKKAATRQGLLPKASPASPRNFKNSSSRMGKSIKKPLSPSSKGVSLKQANRPKKPIARMKPSNRKI